MVDLLLFRETTSVLHICFQAHQGPSKKGFTVRERICCPIQLAHVSGISRSYMHIQLLSLSQPGLSRITAYLEVKIWSLPKHENLTTAKKYCGKEEKLFLRSNFSSFPQYFQYICNFKSPVTYIFIKCG